MGNSHYNVSRLVTGLKIAEFRKIGHMLAAINGWAEIEGLNLDSVVTIEI